MGWWISQGSGEYVASEKHALILDDTYEPDGTKPGAIYCHANSFDATYAITPGSTIMDELCRLAGYGIPVLSCDLGGASTWGNETSQTRIGLAKMFLQGTWGAKSGKIALIGTSAGALASLNYARANPALVSCVALEYPAIDLPLLHSNGDLTASVEAAYGDTGGYDAAVATHDPAQNAAGHTVPIRLWYSPGDEIASPSAVEAFDSACASATAVQIPGGPGHIGRPVPAGDLAWFVTANA